MYLKIKTEYSYLNTIDFFNKVVETLSRQCTLSIKLLGSKDPAIRSYVKDISKHIKQISYDGELLKECIVTG